MQIKSSGRPTPNKAAKAKVSPHEERGAFLRVMQGAAKRVDRLDHTIRYAARHGAEGAQLLKLQASVYEHSHQIETMSEIVKKSVGSVKQVMSGSN